uniref:Uncharacterized protein n=1 Tax=Arundo donax TaxID=35708 RepID=A0A0A9AHX9_ARUDO
MLTGQAAQTLGNQLLAMVSSWVTIWFPDLPNDSTLYLGPVQRLNIGRLPMP